MIVAASSPIQFWVRSPLILDHCKTMILKSWFLMISWDHRGSYVEELKKSDMIQIDPNWIWANVWTKNLSDGGEQMNPIDADRTLEGRPWENLEEKLECSAHWRLSDEKNWHHPTTSLPFCYHPQHSWQNFGSGCELVFLSKFPYLKVNFSEYFGILTFSIIALQYSSCPLNQP